MTKIALVTTTINIPTVLELYRAYGPTIGIFIAGDERTPHSAVEELAQKLQNCNYYSPSDQRQLGYKCSDLLPWNSISRRNIAILEALKWGADIIVLIDDDNIPLHPSYFVDFRWILRSPFNGLKLSTASGWFDVGSLLSPEAPHRGFPRTKASDPIVSHVTSARVGVAAGICLGDPDISAITRIARQPIVHQTSRLLEAGLVVDPSNWTVFNSQNTAFIRELAPCFLMVPQFQRYDDIFASLIAQQYMRANNLHVHFGLPFVWQQRNSHDLLNDLLLEIWGEIHILDFVHRLAVSTNGSAPEVVVRIFDSLNTHVLVADGTRKLVDAWLEDINKVL